MKTIKLLAVLALGLVGCVSAEEHDDLSVNERGDETPPVWFPASGSAGAGGAVAPAPVVTGAGGAVAPAPVVTGAGGAVAPVTVVTGAGGAVAPAPVLVGYGEACPAGQVGGDPAYVSCKSGVCVSSGTDSAVCGCRYSDECGTGGQICERGVCQYQGQTIGEQSDGTVRTIYDLKINCRTLSDCPVSWFTPTTAICDASGMCNRRPPGY